MTPLHDTPNQSVGSTKRWKKKKKKSRTTSLLILSRWHWLRRKEKGRGGGGRKLLPKSIYAPLCSKVLCDSGWQSKHSSCATAMYKNTAKRQNIGVSLFKSSGWTERGRRGGGLEDVWALSEKSSWNKKQLKEHSFPHYPSHVPAS